MTLNFHTLNQILRDIFGGLIVVHISLSIILLFVSIIVYSKRNRSCEKFVNGQLQIKGQCVLRLNFRRMNQLSENVRK